MIFRKFRPVAVTRRFFKDPMAGMTQEEIKAHKKEIKSQTRRTFSIAYGIIGGGMTIVVFKYL
jgi:hypothetical protein